MSRIFRYCTLAAQGCLVAFVSGTIFYFPIRVTFEIERNVWQMSDENKPWYLGSLAGLLIALVHLSAEAALLSIFRYAGVESAKAALIFPTFYLVVCITAWYAGHLPRGIMANPLLSVLPPIVLVMRERQEQNTTLTPTVAKEGKWPQPKSQVVPEYCYEALTHRKSIRILKLFPSNTFEAPLEGQLFEVSLDNTPSYTALSYAWEETSAKRSFICNRKAKVITKNCARALQRIRQMQGGNSVNIWVDSICINQGTTPEALSERTQQIRIMGQVYKTASQVVAWIGEHNYYSKNICETFKSIGDAFDPELDHTSAWRNAED